MDWWIIAIVIITVVFLIADWFIVMGPDMRRWKGGRKAWQTIRSSARRR